MRRITWWAPAAAAALVLPLCAGAVHAENRGIEPPVKPVITQVFPRDGGARVRWAAADDGGDDLRS